MNMGQCAYDNMCSSFSDFGILGSYIALSLSLFLNFDSILFQFYPDKIRTKCGESEFVKNLYSLSFCTLFIKEDIKLLYILGSHHVYLFYVMKYFSCLKNFHFLTQLEIH